MDKHCRMIEGYEPQFLKVSPKQDLILKHYMIIMWRINLLEGYIRPGAIKHILGMATKLMTLGYNFAIHRINNPPYIVSTPNNFGRIIIFINSRLSWDMSL